MENNTILVRGAREHNLRDVDLELPRNRLICFTGVSGSGKSSLAFDTLYAEGQRRYVESLSSYARQFMGQMQKPDVDHLSGLSPSISIQQKTAGRNPRSTVGTITEIYDYFRVLYARIGQGHCPACDRPITAQSREQIINRILALPEKTKCLILGPVVRGQKGEYKDLFEDMLKRGYVRARVDGQVVHLSEDLKLDRQIKHKIEIVTDRIQVDAKSRARIAEGVEQALGLGDGNLIVSYESKADAWDDLILSAHYACTYCNKSYDPPSPQMFSFNSPQGMCLDCDGLGIRHAFDPDLLVPDPTVSFFNGALPMVGPMKKMGRWRKHIFLGVADTLGIDLEKPWNKLSPKQQDWLLYGSGDTHIAYTYKSRGQVWKHGGTWEGLIPQFISSYKKAAAGPRRMQLEKYMRRMHCPTCKGERLNAQARAVRVGGMRLVETCGQPVDEIFSFVTEHLPGKLTAVEKHIASEVLKEISGRLQFLLDVGLHYLSLDRAAPTLSGGEAQRIRLAGQIGCGLVGVLYILDEPSIGLHPRDNERLLTSLKHLRDMGNTVIVVEHDEDTMRAADHIVDFGPGPGVRGGEVVASGTYSEVVSSRKSITGQYLKGRKSIPVPAKRRTGNGNKLKINGAAHNNLKNINVEFPLGCFIGITGVSGSGKSSLINDILLAGLKAQLGSPSAARSASKDSSKDTSEENDADENEPSIGRHRRLSGVQHIDKVIDIDQSPIGRTPRSNPATYIKLFDEIRSLYATLPQAKIRGYKPGRFSFNISGGRCEACQGNGSNRLEMDFLADVWVPCPVCEGHRFTRETLQVRFKDKSIHDVLEMDVQEALVHFDNVPKVRAMLQTLHDVGLDYLKLGQPSPTLSGGEAQRIKLARELVRRSTDKTLYILDEPTTGLHFDDIQKLLEVLHGFVEQGNTVIVIEHNLDVIKTVDWLIDLGPEGGAGGGELVEVGPPEKIAKCASSHTGKALKPVLAPKKSTPGKRVSSRKRTAKKNGLLETITIEGAQQHNLKNVTIALPRDAMSVCCGPSGSGKSSLAIDTIYAEGQRRYVESLSAYARQFLGQMQKPRVDHVSGLSPAISIEQKAASKSPRSTVGTVTEIYDYLRILYARLGHPFCPKCDIAIGTQTSDEIIEKIIAEPEGTKLYIMAPIERKGQEKYDVLWDEIRRTGFVRMRVDKKTYNVEEPPKIDHRRKHKIEVVIDRIVVRHNQRGRIADAVEAGLDLGRGVLHVAHVDDKITEKRWKVDRYSQHFACDKCGQSFEQLNPHHFSFNSPLGWCPTCEGLGFQQGASPAALIRMSDQSINEGVIAAWPPMDNEAFRPFVESIARQVDFSLDTPFKDLSPKAQKAILHGTGNDLLELNTQHSALVTDSCPALPRFQYKGLFPAIAEASRVSHSYRQRLDYLVSEVACFTCGGSRLRDDAGAVQFHDKTLGQLGDLPLNETLSFFKNLKLDATQKRVAGELVREIQNRLQFLVDVGLDYLSLNRPAPTLSGGETQRIRLASQIGSGLTGVLYVLDEPTIGLHPRDNRRLITALARLRDLGNTLLLVEHDKEVIAQADYLLDFGPGAGHRGGEIVAEGPPSRVKRRKASLTGNYLSGKKAIPIPTNRRKISPPCPALLIKGARHNNLKNIDVELPLGCFIAITGVSGSGKSSLINDVLYNTLARKLHRARTTVAAHDEILGLEEIDKVINVDQAPIGNSPNSNPATYTGAFELIRQLFAMLPESKVRGWQPRRFSFNKPGGRCEECEGNGQQLIEMHFLPDVWVECDTCHGARYNTETLLVRYRNHTISDVLNMQVGQALEVFQHIPKIRRILKTLSDVGLDYLALGQAAPTLSGGEAQRVKLAAELSRPNTGRTVYILDEPTTGLHFDDIRKLLDVLNRLVDLGNTVIVVEHNLDVIKTADWIIDIGPEAGGEGGKVVVVGPPEQVVAQPSGSHTCEILKGVLAQGPHAEREKYDAGAEFPDGEPDVLTEIGEEVDMPWDTDGRRWHTKDRINRNGKPCNWEGAALDWIVDEIQGLGEFGETNWNNRTMVEIAAPVKSRGWFFHASTGEEWVVWFTFRVGRNTFKKVDLQQKLKIKPLDETDGINAYSPTERVQVKNERGPWQRIQIGVHWLKEIDTPAFRKFLKEAAAAFDKSLKRMQTKPEDLMPWKINGERWHLSEKGFRPGRPIKWDRALFPKFLDLIRRVVPDLDISWNIRDAVHMRPTGAKKPWARLKTKENSGMQCFFLGKKGHLNMAHLEGLGVGSDLNTNVAYGDVLQLTFHQDLGIRWAELEKAMKEQVAGFQEEWAKG